MKIYKDQMAKIFQTSSNRIKKILKAMNYLLKPKYDEINP